MAPDSSAEQMVVGTPVGTWSDGIVEGYKLGKADGNSDGSAEGSSEGTSVGVTEGRLEGNTDNDGCVVFDAEDCSSDGDAGNEGTGEGDCVMDDGDSDEVGTVVGNSDVASRRSGAVALVTDLTLVRFASSIASSNVSINSSRVTPLRGKSPGHPQRMFPSALSSKGFTRGRGKSDREDCSLVAVATRRPDTTWSNNPTSPSHSLHVPVT